MERSPLPSRHVLGLLLVSCGSCIHAPGALMRAESLPPGHVEVSASLQYLHASHGFVSPDSTNTRYGLDELPRMHLSITAELGMTERFALAGGAGLSMLYGAMKYALLRGDRVNMAIVSSHLIDTESYWTDAALILGVKLGKRLELNAAPFFGRRFAYELTRRVTQAERQAAGAQSRDLFAYGLRDNLLLQLSPKLALGVACTWARFASTDAQLIQVEGGLLFHFASGS